jgi:ribosome-associated toxin RatA of RatAB toxin-antitoxin module
MIPSYNITISFIIFLLFCILLHTWSFKEVLGNELKINFARLDFTFSYKLIEIKRKGSTFTKKNKP